MESQPESQDEHFKGAGKSKTLNGHSVIEEEDLGPRLSSHSGNMENGETDCKSPQINGDICEKIALDNKSEKVETDSTCVIKESNEIACVKDSLPENGKPCVKEDSSDSAMESIDNSNKDNTSSKNPQSDSDDNPVSSNIKSGEDKNENVNSDLVKPSDSETNTASVNNSNETNSEKSSESVPDLKNVESNDVKKTEEDKIESSTVSENNSESEKTKSESVNAVEESSEGDKDQPKSTASDGTTTTTSSTTTTTTTTSTLTPSPTKKGSKKKDDQPKPEIVKRVTRSSSGITKPVKYIDPDPRDISDDDDDIKITKEVKKDDESDIEMIEESDPLAISDADVKKAKEANKHSGSSHERMKSFKQKESSSKSKDSSNVIIIDTNTLMKNQTSGGSSSSAKVSNSVSASAQTTGSVAAPATSNIQTAIQAITGGNPAMQGLQSAYLNAIQQVLVAQGGSQVSNPHYIATLQQYYNTLGALQDDAYVIEAPSFIVPYVMEGKPVEAIKDYLDRLKKEEEEFEKKKKEEEEEKKKKEEEEKKKKEEEEAAKLKEEGGDEKDKEKEEKMEVEGEEEKKEESKDEKMEVEEETKEDEEKEKKEKEDEETVKEEEKEEDDEKEKKSTEVEKDEKSSTEESSETKPKTKEKSQEDENKENKSDGEAKKTGDNKEKKGEEEKKGDEEVIDLDKEGDKEDLKHLGRWEGYYKSALGKFFLELGLNHAQEFIQSDLLRMQKRRVEKLKTNPTRQDIISIKSLERQLNASKERNSHLYVPLKTCRFCSFKTESALVMERHLESPHMVNYTYKCNFCEFETRGPQVILFHTEAEHNVRGRLERAPAFFQCPLCPFEDNNKSKMTRHSFSCSKKFKADRNCDLSDWEPPAKIPKIHRGRPNTSSFGKAFDALKMPNILPKNFGGLSLNLQNAITSSLLGNSGTNAANANSLAGRGRGRPVGSYKNISPTVGTRSGSLVYPNRASNMLQPMQGVTTAQQLNLANQVLQSVTQGTSNRVPRLLPSSSTGNIIPGLTASSSITIQSVQNKSGNTKSPQQPSISITPLPRGGTQSTGNKTTTTNISSNNSQRPAFVICEICDGYIKDLEQLRNHMNLIHKVKIHPKMIYNRPPLNCQKCQHRFFTDQGLERHLLGTHGLVTSSMQEAANKGKDAGRCPICGKVFQWKLLNHVSRDHKMTLKPAHLSYKCTVCTATFNMYRLFENHVYSAHSVVNKNKGSESGSSSSSSTTTAKKSVTGSEAPLKINDEITIIPQPASKSPKADSKSSPKKNDSPSVSKEITITKVGSRSSRRSGGGVEVISLDDSPQKKLTEDTPKKRTRDTATSKRARTSS